MVEWNANPPPLSQYSAVRRVSTPKTIVSWLDTKMFGFWMFLIFECSVLGFARYKTFLRYLWTPQSTYQVVTEASNPVFSRFCQKFVRLRGEKNRDSDVTFEQRRSVGFDVFQQRIQLTWRIIQRRYQIINYFFNVVPSSEETSFFRTYLFG